MRKAIAVLCLVLLMLPLSGGGSQQVGGTLAVGSSGEQVKRLQLRLMDAGFLTGLADGQYGAGTKQAVSAAQQALKDRGYSLKVDGIAGSQTLGLLYDDQVMAPFIDFSSGASGQRVISLQNRLIDLKFLAGPADGVFGTKTLEALQAFQRHLSGRGAEGIEVNGRADAATRRWLAPDADLSAFGIHAPEFFDDTKPERLDDGYLNAQSAILVRVRTGDILYAKNMEERMYPASTTKMMTLLLALECGGLDKVVELPASTGKVAPDSSLVPVYPGERMTLRDLLFGLMLRSGNDAANAIAELCAGSVEAFVMRMNARAEQLGMRGTHFTNPHGYHHKDHYSTARDLAVLAVYAMSNPEFAAIATTMSHEMQATARRGVLLIRNTSELLNPADPHYFAGAAGIKSGYTSFAGFCYVGSAMRGDEQLIAVILGSRTRNRGWDDMARLFRLGFYKLGK